MPIAATRRLAGKVLEEIADQLLGPANKRKALIAKNYQRHTLSSGTVNAKVHLYANIVDRLLRHPVLLFPALDHLEPLGESAPVENLEYRVRGAMHQLASKQPEAFVAALQDTPWLAEVDEFRVWAIGENVDQWPLVQLLEHLRKQNSKKRGDIVAALTSVKPTFGAEFLASFLIEEDPFTDGESPRQAVLQLVAGRMDEIEQLPNEYQIQLATAMEFLLNKPVAADNAGPNAAQAWIEKCLGGRTAQIVERFVNAKRLEELGIEDHQVREVDGPEARRT